MKFDETKQYVIEENGVLVVKDLPIEEPKVEEHIFEPAIDPKLLKQPSLEKRVSTVEQEQETIINVLTDIMGV